MKKAKVNLNPLDRKVMSRGQMKTAGGKIVASKRAGEVTFQVWELWDLYWSGNDWYDDNMAQIYEGAPNWFKDKQK